MESTLGKQNRLSANTNLDRMIEQGKPEWNVKLDIMCEDCEIMHHCNIVNRFRGNQVEQAVGRMMADSRGRVSFGYNYGTSYQDWFDWTVTIFN